MQAETCHLLGQLVNFSSKQFQLLLHGVYGGIFSGFFYFDLLSGDMLYGSSELFQEDMPALITDDDD